MVGQGRKSSSRLLVAYVALHCFLVLLISLLSTGQALACLWLVSPKLLRLHLNQCWFYLVYSCTIGLIFMRHLLHLSCRTVDLPDKVVFVLLHSYLAIGTDLALALYYCVQVQLKGTEMVVLCSTLLARMILCYLFIKAIQRWFVY